MPDQSPPLIYVDLIEEEPAPPVPGLADEHYRTYLKAFQPWRIMILSGDNGARLFRSTERYFNRDDAIHAAELAFGARSNVYLREKEHGNVPIRMAT